MSAGCYVFKKYTIYLNTCCNQQTNVIITTTPIIIIVVIVTDQEEDQEYYREITWKKWKIRRYEIRDCDERRS